MKEKCVTFRFINFNAKVSPNSSGRVTSPQRSYVSSFKVNIYSLCFLLKPYLCNSGKVKHEIITRNWKYDLPHKLPKHLSFRILGNEENFHWLNNSWTRGFELATRRFELVTRGFELLTRRFELPTSEFKLVTHEFELADLNS